MTPYVHFSLQSGAGNFYSPPLPFGSSTLIALHVSLGISHAQHHHRDSACLMVFEGDVSSSLQVPAPWTAELCKAVARVMESLSSMQNLLPSDELSVIGQV